VSPLPCQVGLPQVCPDSELSPHIESAADMDVVINSTVTSATHTPETAQSSAEWSNHLSAPPFHPFIPGASIGPTVPVPETPQEIFQLFFYT